MLPEMPESLMPHSQELPLAVFDRDGVLDLVDGEVELLQELAEMFLDDLPGQVELIQSALAASDASAVNLVTHQLKSSVGNLGGRAAHEVIHKLEDASREDNLADANEQFAICQRELEQFQAALSDFLNEQHPQ
jgi:HPt (histidine-containing phosphotransfer) domain-containing protein